MVGSPVRYTNIMRFEKKKERAKLCTECGKNPPNYELDSYDICDSCRDLMNIPYLKKESEKKPEKIGNIRI